MPKGFSGRLNSGKAWLELTSAEAEWIYVPYRTLAQLQQFAITGVLPEGWQQ